MYILSDSPWLTKTCQRRPYRIIWKLRVFWLTYRTMRMSCSAMTRSRSATRRTYSTGSGLSSRRAFAPPGWRLRMTTGCVRASSSSGRYHWRIWYMFTAESAKYTAMRYSPVGDGARSASFRCRVPRARR
ncbi:hypothetical protein CMsap09_06685 [Clavibacter michiganensis]|uniref:Uncharacterized protein n=1 Tax=Clavibacter michiganensis TaxID=28447 RepID=A0A251XSX9_9MICO|nr:hypothetical protein CMsap09_06685 [Clavibacter michiganensis]